MKQWIIALLLMVVGIYFYDSGSDLLGILFGSLGVALWIKLEITKRTTKIKTPEIHEKQ